MRLERESARVREYTEPTRSCLLKPLIGRSRVQCRLATAYEFYLGKQTVLSANVGSKPATTTNGGHLEHRKSSCGDTVRASRASRWLAERFAATSTTLNTNESHSSADKICIKSHARECAPPPGNNCTHRSPPTPLHLQVRRTAKG